MKRLISLVLCLLVLSSMVACGNSTNGGSATSSGESSAPVGSSSADTISSAAVSEASGGEPVTIRVATLSQQLSLPMYYISKQGWDVENGFKLEISTFTQGSGVNEALGSGLVDVFTIGAAAISSCSVYDAVYLFSHEDSAAGQQYMVRNDSPIAQTTGYLTDYPEVLGSPETVKDATILLQMGTAAQMVIDYYLNLMGLTEDDVTLINMEDAAGYQAFVSGEGDMVKTSYPTADNFDPAQYSIACSMENMKIPYYDNILVSRKFYDDTSKHDALIALGVQLLRAADAFKDNAVLMDNMMEWYELNGQVAKRENIEHQVLARPFFTYEDMKEIDYSKSFVMTAEFYAAVGNISEEDLAHVKRNIDTTILPKVLDAFAVNYR